MREEECEREYRRGYMDGFVQAIDAMHDLMFQGGLTRQAAYDACWKHHEGALWAWRDQKPPLSRFDFPPEVGG